MKLQFPVILSSVLIFFSCKNAVTYTEDSSHAVIIHSPQHIKDLQVAKYSEVFDSVKIIPLQSPANALIGQIDKILVHNNNIFILDQVQGKAVFEFDINGKFIRRFGRIGRGPGEYIEPNDISVNDKELSIWVNDQRKFIIYDLNGNVLREIRTGSVGKCGVPINADRYALYMDIGGDVKTDEKYDLKVFDHFGKNTNIGFEKKDKNFSKGSFFFSQNDNGFLVSPGYSNNIYEIRSNSDVLVKKYKIDFGQYTLPEDFSLKYGTPIRFLRGLDRSGYATLSGYWETPGFLVYSFSYKGLIYEVYYSKSTGKIKYGNAWFNNVYGIFSGTNKGAYRDYVISVFDPSNLVSYQKNYTAPPSKIQTDTIAVAANKFYGLNTDGEKFVPGDFAYSQEEIDQLQSIKASDNPVIIIKKLKQF